MTHDEAIKHINSICYEFKSDCKIWSKLYSFKRENLELLKEIKEEIPELHIYEKISKFQLIKTL